MESKYLSDGRKVVVIGALNNQESIVQEIFVTVAGDEIPSGERFVTKSLHDEPVKSYKEKQVEKAESDLKQIESDKKIAEKEIRSVREKLKGFRALFKQVELLKKNLSPSALDTLCGVMSGSIEWVVASGYDGFTLIPFDDAIFRYENNYGNRQFDMIKLVSLLGRSDGNVDYRINRYSDGSGDSSDTVVFFDDKLDALNYIAKLIKDSDRKISVKKMDEYILMGVEIDIADVLAIVNNELKIQSESLEGVKQMKVRSIKEKEVIVETLKRRIKDANI